MQVTDDAAADYVLCISKLAQHADYLVVNVSSPNTPGASAQGAVLRVLALVHLHSTNALQRTCACAAMRNVRPQIQHRCMPASAQAGSGRHGRAFARCCLQCAGLRGLQGRKELDVLITKVKAARDQLPWGALGPPPLLVKIAPDLPPSERKDVATVVLRHNLQVSRVHMISFGCSAVSGNAPAAGEALAACARTAANSGCEMCRASLWAIPR